MKGLTSEGDERKEVKGDCALYTHVCSCALSKAKGRHRERERKSVKKMMSNERLKQEVIQGRKREGGALKPKIVVEEEGRRGGGGGKRRERETQFHKR